MTILEAIDLLKTMHTRHGNVSIYFDCPNCKQSYAPEVLKAEPVAIHLTGAKD